MLIDYFTFATVLVYYIFLLQLCLIFTQPVNGGRKPDHPRGKSHDFQLWNDAPFLLCMGTRKKAREIYVHKGKIVHYIICHFVAVKPILSSTRLHCVHFNDIAWTCLGKTAISVQLVSGMSMTWQRKPGNYVVILCTRSFCQGLYFVLHFIIS